MIGQHPDDLPTLTRAEVWGRVSLALLLGVSLAAAKTSIEMRADVVDLEGIGGVRKRESVGKLYGRLLETSLRGRGLSCSEMSDRAMKRAVDYGVFLERSQLEDDGVFDEKARAHVSQSVRQYFERFKRSCVQSSSVSMSGLRPKKRKTR